MSKLWKKFRKTGEEQNILPPAPTGAVTAFAGSVIPGGWLNLAGGPYYASDYEALALVIGVVQPANQYLQLPSVNGKAPVGDFENLDTSLATPLYARSGGTLLATPLTSAQSGVRAHSHQMGNTHNHSIGGASSHQHLLYTRATASYYAEPTYQIISNFPTGYAFATSQTPRPPSFSSSTSTYNLTLASAKTDATIVSYQGDAGNAAQSIYNYGDSHANVQPSLQLTYIIKT
jgi:Phage Tail Collar Domain